MTKPIALIVRTVCLLLTICLLLATVLKAADYMGPSTLVLSRDGKSLYVAEMDGQQIAVIDLATQKVTRSIKVPADPTGMALSPDGSKLYVTCAAPVSTVCEMNVNSGQVTTLLTTGHTATGAAVTPDGKQLYVCNRFNNNVSVIDLETRKEIARVPAVREPCAAAVTPDGKCVYVLNLLPLGRSGAYDLTAEITVIDTTTQKAHKIRLPNGSSSVRGLCISPDGKYVYVVHVLSRYKLPTTQLERGWMNTNALSIIDAVKRQLINTVLLDDVDLGAANPWAVTISADSKTLFVSHAGTHEVSVIDIEGLMTKLLKLSTPAIVPTEKLAPKVGDKGYSAPIAMKMGDVSNDLTFLAELRKRIQLNGRGPHGITVAGSKLYVAEYFSDSVGVVDLDSKAPAPVSQIVLGPKPELTIERRGQLLFSDATLCFQHWQSCETCHPDARTDGLSWDLLNDGAGNPKKTRTMVNVHSRGGPAMSLGVRETPEAAVRAGIKHILFAVRPEEDALAMDAYLKSIQPVPSPYLVNGKLSPAAEHGKKVFFDMRTRCAACHPEPFYSDIKVHDVGSTGKFDKPTDQFNTPQLTEIWRVAPYMHDGSALTIEEVFTKHNAKDKHGITSHLSKEEIADLVEYLLSL